MANVTFVMIVCNGDDFLKECLECVYPYAHSICIAEGATRKWMKALGWSNPRSQDNTLDIINKFPDSKCKIKLANSVSAYSDKDNQINRAMRLVPRDTDYIWELDADELYRDRDLKHMMGILAKKRVTYVEMNMYNFFKNIDTIAYGTKKGIWGYDTPVPRIFRYHPGAMFSKHRPPTLLNENGINVKKIKPMLSYNPNNIKAYHYSYVTNKQVESKIKYYERVFKKPYVDEWYKKVWLRWDDNRDAVESRFSVHPSSLGYKTKSFHGRHPKPIMKKYGRKT